MKKPKPKQNKNKKHEQTKKKQQQAQQQTRRRWDCVLTSCRESICNTFEYQLNYSEGIYVTLKVAPKSYLHTKEVDYI